MNALRALLEEGISKVALVVFERNERECILGTQGFYAKEDLGYRNKALIEFQRIDT